MSALTSEKKQLTLAELCYQATGGNALSALALALDYRRVFGDVTPTALRHLDEDELRRRAKTSVDELPELLKAAAG